MIRAAVIRGLVQSALLPGTAPEDTATPQLTPAALRAARYPSLTAVYSDIVDMLIRVHTHALHEVVQQQRSIAQSLDAALQASWTVVEERLDEHLAVKQILLSRMTLRPAGEMSRTAHEHVLLQVGVAIDAFTRQLAVTWNYTTDELARFLLASFDGLILDYAKHEDPGGSQELVRLLAVHLALHGRGPIKNRRRPSAATTAD